MAVTQSTPESLEIDVVPPALEDADGVLPAARVVVFRASEKVEELVALGCQRTGRSDMLAVAVGSDAAERPEIREAIAGSTFASHAFMDRAGGLAWPTPALLVRFEADADASARQQAIQLLGSAHLETSCYTHAPNLARVKLDVRTGSRVIDAALLLASHPAVAFAETDLNFTGSGGFVPNDPGFSLCWGHRNSSGFDMRSTFAWDSTLGSPSVRVLVIDVGVDESHPDLNLSPGRDFTDGSIDGSEGGQPRVTCDRHGTPVAGCISAIADNSLGTVGIAPGCRSVSARCFVSTSNCSGSWSANYSWTANALDWAAGQGIQVSNNSNIYGSSSSAVADAYASTRLGGMIHFACAGNNGNAVITYPATLPTVLAIGAAASNGVRASFLATARNSLPWLLGAGSTARTIPDPRATATATTAASRERRSRRPTPPASPHSPCPPTRR